MGNTNGENVGELRAALDLAQWRLREIAELCERTAKSPADWMEHDLANEVSALLASHYHDTPTLSDNDKPVIRRYSCA